MSKKSIVQFSMAVLAFVLFLSFDANAQKQTVRSSCSRTTDADVVKAIKDKFSADENIKDQMQHINVSVKNRRVTLGGWLRGDGTINKAVAYAKSVKCVRQVTSKLSPYHKVGCGAGQRPCGDTCIGRNETCTILN
jgi:osmotically-inducible protein OsmY